MPFNPVVSWTGPGMQSRVNFQAAHGMPPPEAAAFANALNDALMAWSQMTMATYPPANPTQSGGRVSYTFGNPPQPRACQVNWTVTPQNWQANVGVTLKVINIV